MNPGSLSGRLIPKAFLLVLLLALAGHAQSATTDSPLFPALSLVAGVLNEPLFPESPAYTTNDDIVIHAADGVNLEANIFVPTEDSAPYPAVIFVNSWGLNEYEYLTEAGRLAERGYVVLSYSTRGWGESGGEINTAGPKDVSDFSTVVDWLITNAPVDPNGIGASGISYGAGIAMLGAAHDERIKAVSAMSGWGSLVESLYAQRTPRLVWGELLTFTGDLLGNPSQEIQENWDNVKNHRNIEDVTEWALERSPINYVDQLNENGTAVYLANNWGDNLFQANSVLDMYQQLDGPKAINLQAGMHASTELIGMIGGGDTRIWNNTRRWFDQHLKGQSTAIEDQEPVQMKVRLTDRFEGFSTFPVPQAETRHWFLHPRSWFSNGKLENSAWEGWGSRTNSFSDWGDTLASTGIPLGSQIFDQVNLPVTAPVPLLGRSRSAWYRTERLQEPLRIRGIPEVTLNVTPRDDALQLVAYLYDLSPDGKGRLITHAPITVPDAAPGEPLELDLDLVATGYDVPAGHRVALVVDGKDLLYAGPDGVQSQSINFSGSAVNRLSIPAL
ncbi:acyl esterase [Halovibrio salipaludis]|uniref:Acyl esterase n=1 Tax=Halovibrio salipaludis TaxID=2032626 RepID=A0A2A2F644_9GAMM|nr:CocE/NonD family hydrolase [Halovibrio salipaludis]PAU80408.1 acyl esterase [Halovibrio salipaludis]